MVTITIPGSLLALGGIAVMVFCLWVLLAMFERLDTRQRRNRSV